MKKIVDWINSHKILTICVTVVLFVGQPLFVHWMFKTEARSLYWENTWSAGDLLGYIAGFEAFIGTVFLGVVAVRQNDKANMLSEKMIENEHQKDLFSRQPKVIASDCILGMCTKGDMWNPVHGMFFCSPDEIPNRLYNDESFISIKLVIHNLSQVPAEIRFEDIIVDHGSSNKDHLRFVEQLSTIQRNISYISAVGKIPLDIILPSNTFSSDAQTIVTFHLVLRNSINELVDEYINIEVLGKGANDVRILY